MKNKYQVQKGFTLVELLVSVAIFAIVMTISIGAILNIVDSNKKAQSLKSVMNNLNFALENMTRTIKTGTNYEVDGQCSGNGETISVRNSEGQFITYSYDENKLFISGDRYGNDSIAITAEEISIDYLKFYLTGGCPSDGAQPKVVVVIKGFAGVQEKTRSEFSLQTTISQRLIDQ